MLTGLQKTAIREALRNAFGERRFSICGVGDAWNILNPKMDTNCRYFTHLPQYAVLHALHMTEWKHLSRAEVVALVNMVGEVLGFKPDAQDIAMVQALPTVEIAPAIRIGAHAEA